jgi:hypothetical protein
MKIKENEMTKREKFIEEFNALLSKFKVDISVRERNFAMQTVADGIGFDFDWTEEDGITESIECGMFIDEIKDTE